MVHGAPTRSAPHGPASTTKKPPSRVAFFVGGPDALGFDVARFVENHGTVYVLGSEKTAGDLAPLITAFVEEVFFTAGEIALTRPNERLDPPLTNVLDELPNICPLPDLPSTLSDSAGRGILTHWAAQSKAQMTKGFGETGTEILLDNTTAVSIFGGLKSKPTREWASSMCGRRIEERQSRKAEPLEVNLGRQISQERVDLLSPSDIRELPPGRVLVVFRHMKPIIAVTRKAWELPEWPQLQADRKSVIARALEPVPDDVDDVMFGLSAPLSPLPEEEAAA